jgi:biopolymer transport protein ExbD
VTRGGKIYLEKAAVARAELGAHLQRAHDAAPHRRLVLKGDREARWADLRAIFKECHSIGFPGVALQVGDKRKGEARKGGN